VEGADLALSRQEGSCIAGGGRFVMPVRKGADLVRGDEEFARTEGISPGSFIYRAKKKGLYLLL
jgi:hypothetical protein